MLKILFGKFYAFGQQMSIMGLFLRIRKKTLCHSNSFFISLLLFSDNETTIMANKERRVFKRSNIPFFAMHSVFYTLIVLLFTYLFRFFPSAVSLENGIYDGLQRYITIDSKDDYFYGKYADYIEDLVLVNIDSTIIDSETDRINRQKLAQFMQRIAASQDDVRCVFFDYAFFRPSPHDSAFIESLKPFGEKVILPYYFEFADKERITISNPVDASQITAFQEPIYNHCTRGYVKAYSEPVSFLHRYVIYKIVTTEGREFEYVPYVIASRFNAEKYEPVSDKLLEQMTEIKYILRNKDLPNKERASLVYSINDFINVIPKQEVARLLTDKIVVVGLFEGYQTKYGLEIDKFPTPVQGNLSGPQIIVNAYLNIISGTIIRKGSLISIFWFNLIVGLFIAMYRKYLEGVKVEMVWYIIRFLSNLFISFFIFPMVAAVFYIFSDTKLLLGISMFIFLQHYPLYIVIKSIYTKAERLVLGKRQRRKDESQYKGV